MTITLTKLKWIFKFDYLAFNTFMCFVSQSPKYSCITDYLWFYGTYFFFNPFLFLVVLNYSQRPSIHFSLWQFFPSLFSPSMSLLLLWFFLSTLPSTWNDIACGRRLAVWLGNLWRDVMFSHWIKNFIKWNKLKRKCKMEERERPVCGSMH